MARRFSGDTLVIATHNPGKVKEISALLGGYAAHYPTAGSLGIPEPDETETTFAGNASLKARAVAKASLMPALADDSGLAVTALGGQPGIYSARWAGPDKDFTAAMQRIDTELAGNPYRSAAFVAALALAWPDGHVETVEGRIEGRLIDQPRGDNGFGYDPWFIPDGHMRTFGEMPPAEKQAISHRTMAFRRLVEKCFAARSL